MLVFSLQLLIIFCCSSFSCLSQNEPVLLEALLNGNADPLQLGFSDVTALHIAAMCGNLEATEVLLDHGVNVNLRDALKFSPLHHATDFGHEKVSISSFCH